MATVDYRFFANVPNVPSVTMLEIAISLALLFSLVFLLTRQELSQRAYHVIRSNPMVFGYLGWITLGALINLAWSTVPAATLKDLLPGFVLFFFVALTVRRSDDAQKVLVVYLLGAVLQILLGASQILNGWPRPVALTENAVYKTDIGGLAVDVGYIPTGLFSHPNGLALFLLPVILLLLSQISQARLTLYKRLGLVALFALSLFVVWHTQSKGALAWLVIGTIVFVLPRALKRWHSRLGWAALVGGILTIMLLSVWINQELGKLGTVVSRIQLNEAALALLKDKPLVSAIGGGSESMYSYSSQYSNMEYPSSHNTYLDQALLFGIPGLVLYIGIAATALRRATAVAREASDHTWRIIGRFLHAAIVAQLGMFYFEPALAGQYQSTFFLFSAIAATMQVSRRIIPREGAV